MKTVVKRQLDPESVNEFLDKQGCNCPYCCTRMTPIWVEFELDLLSRKQPHENSRYNSEPEPYNESWVISYYCLNCQA